VEAKGDLSLPLALARADVGFIATIVFIQFNSTIFTIKGQVFIVSG
jgi:hypothetical protein